MDEITADDDGHHRVAAVPSASSTATAIGPRIPIDRIRAVGGSVGYNKNANTGNGIGSDINGLSSQRNGLNPNQLSVQGSDAWRHLRSRDLWPADLRLERRRRRDLRWVGRLDRAAARRRSKRGWTRCSRAPRTTCGCGEPPGSTRAEPMAHPPSEWEERVVRGARRRYARPEGTDEVRVGRREGAQAV